MLQPKAPAIVLVLVLKVIGDTGWVIAIALHKRLELVCVLIGPLYIAVLVNSNIIRSHSPPEGI